MTFCIKCGNELRPNAKFCHRCGHAVVPTTKQKLVAPPTLSKVESKVYRYIKRHRGELDVRKCAKRLGVSEGDVERAAKSLVEKGKLEAE